MPVVLAINKDLPFADEAKREMTFLFEKANQKNVQLPDDLLKLIGRLVADFNDEKINIYMFSEELTRIMSRLGLNEISEVQYA